MLFFLFLLQFSFPLLFLTFLNKHHNNHYRHLPFQTFPNCKKSSWTLPRSWNMVCNPLWWLLDNKMIFFSKKTKNNFNKTKNNFNEWKLDHASAWWVVQCFASCIFVVVVVNAVQHKLTDKNKNTFLHLVLKQTIKT